MPGSLYSASTRCFRINRDTQSGSNLLLSYPLPATLSVGPDFNLLYKNAAYLPFGRMEAAVERNGSQSSCSHLFKKPTSSVIEVMRDAQMIISYSMESCQKLRT